MNPIGNMNGICSVTKPDDKAIWMVEVSSNASGSGVNNIVIKFGYKKRAVSRVGDENYK